MGSPSEAYGSHINMLMLTCAWSFALRRSTVAKSSSFSPICCAVSRSAARMDALMLSRSHAGIVLAVSTMARAFDVERGVRVGDRPRVGDPGMLLMSEGLLEVDSTSAVPGCIEDSTFPSCLRKSFICIKITFCYQRYLTDSLQAAIARR